VGDPTPEPTVLDVTEFGAVGDGVANDGPAVLAHACFEDFDGFATIRPRFDTDVGAVLYLPAGTYRLGPLPGYDRRHSFPFSRFHIRGDGPGVTTVLLDHVTYPLVRLSIHGDARFGGGVDTSISNLTVASNLSDPGNRTSAEMNIHLRDLHGFEAHDVEVCDGPRIAFHVNSCTDVALRRLHVHDMCTDGIHLVGCRKALIEDCRLTDTGDDAIAVWGGNWWNPEQSSEVTVRANHIERAGSNGIALGGCDHVVVEENTIAGTYLTGIGIRPMDGYGPVSDITIRANHIDDAGFHETGILWGGGIASGIAVADDLHTGLPIERVTVADNVLGRCRNNFLRVKGATEVTVTGNRFEGPLVRGASANQGSGEGSANVDPGTYEPVFVADSTAVSIAADQQGHMATGGDAEHTDEPPAAGGGSSRWRRWARRLAAR